MEIVDEQYIQTALTKHEQIAQTLSSGASFVAALGKLLVAINQCGDLRLPEQGKLLKSDWLRGCVHQIVNQGSSAIQFTLKTFAKLDKRITPKLGDLLQNFQDLKLRQPLVEDLDETVSTTVAIVSDCCNEFSSMTDVIDELSIYVDFMQKNNLQEISKALSDAKTNILEFRRFFDEIMKFFTTTASYLRTDPMARSAASTRGTPKQQKQIGQVVMLYLSSIRTAALLRACHEFSQMSLANLVIGLDSLLASTDPSLPNSFLDPSASLPQTIRQSKTWLHDQLKQASSWLKDRVGKLEQGEMQHLREEEERRERDAQEKQQKLEEERQRDEKERVKQKSLDDERRKIEEKRRQLAVQQAKEEEEQRRKEEKQEKIANQLKLQEQQDNQHSLDDERRKLAEERRSIEEERRKLGQEQHKMNLELRVKAEEQKMRDKERIILDEERRMIDEKRSRLDEEQREMVEERRKIAEARRTLDEERRKFAEEQAKHYEEVELSLAEELKLDEEVQDFVDKQMVLESLLVAAPKSIALLSELCLISTASRDFELSTPIQGFKHAKSTMFRANLHQVINTGTSSFTSAYKNMTHIKTLAQKIPSDVMEILELSLHGDPEDIECELPGKMQSIIDNAGTCNSLAAESEHGFEEMIALINEIAETCTATRSVVEVNTESTSHDKELENLSSLKISQSNAAEITKALIAGILGLSKVRQQWVDLVKFFTELANVIRIEMFEPLESFKERASTAAENRTVQGKSASGYTRETLQTRAREIATKGFQAHMLAAMYIGISKSHIHGPLVKLDELLTITDADQVDSLRKEIAAKCERSQKDIREMAVQHTVEPFKRFKQKMMELGAGTDVHQKYAPPSSDDEQEEITAPQV